MQLLPKASTPDGLISARYAVITKTPGWEVLTTTSDVNVTQGHGWGKRGGGGAKGRPPALSTGQCPGDSWGRRPDRTCSAQHSVT